MPNQGWRLLFMMSRELTVLGLMHRGLSATPSALSEDEPAIRQSGTHPTRLVCRSARMLRVMESLPD